MDWVEQVRSDCRNAIGRVMVNVSGGASSALAWKRCLDWYGPDRVEPVFADTLSEDDDLYRFLADCEAAFGQRLVRLWTRMSDWSVQVGTLDSPSINGADIWDCFAYHRMTRMPAMGNACKASVELKQKPLDAHFIKGGFAAQAIGMQVSEPDRIERRRTLLSPALALFPLVASPALSHCQILEELRQLGIDPPATYEAGFQHNNCLMYGCVLSGNQQWAGFLETFPERYAETERLSERFFAETGFSLCRDRRGGKLKPMTLTQLREEVERGERWAGDWQSNCSCMEQLELFNRT